MPPTFTQSPYTILHISPLAPSSHIRRAYRALALREHPDKAGNTPEANARFARIQAAYEVLIDPAERRRYDEDPAAYHCCCCRSDSSSSSSGSGNDNSDEGEGEDEDGEEEGDDGEGGGEEGGGDGVTPIPDLEEVLRVFAAHRRLHRLGNGGGGEALREFDEVYFRVLIKHLEERAGAQVALAEKLDEMLGDSVVGMMMMMVSGDDDSGEGGNGSGDLVKEHEGCALAIWEMDGDFPGDAPMTSFVPVLEDALDRTVVKRPRIFVALEEHWLGLPS
ncbi:hypothetical protein F4778DRAFT_783120 [Xylariomycetidae sp. FL2044]|nr:hypothetical protein F4778DRAFT_783120 [Xylariomycetidae sp. FL2044]